MEGFSRGCHYVGAEAIFGFRVQWEDSKAVVERYLDAGEYVVALGFDEGTYRSTGRSMRAELAYVIELEGGRIVRFVQYPDTLEVAEAVGLVRER
jgi:ketosteroid isomerase-like protein